MVRWITRFCLLLFILITSFSWFSGCASSSRPESPADYRTDRHVSADPGEPRRASGEDDGLNRAAQEGDLLMAEGRPYRALRRYLAALGEEKSRSLMNEEELKVLLEKSRRIVEKISIEPLTAGMTVKMGRPFSSPFIAKIIFDGGENGLPDVRLLVRHKIPGESVAPGESLLRFVSDETGSISYKPSVSFFAGNGAVYISLDLAGELEEIEAHPFSQPDTLEKYRALKRSINAVQAVFPYRVEETRDRMMLGILIFDRDSAGNPTGGNYTASGFAGVFNSALFDVHILEADTENPDEDPRETARRFGREHVQTGWLIYGNSRISQYEERGGRIHITVIGSARAIPLAPERTGYATGEMKKSLIGSNSRSTVLSAYRQLGKILGSELLDHLE
jgi:hypothetical protein